MSRTITPTLESITVKGKYRLLATDFSHIAFLIYEFLKEYGWVKYYEIGNSIILQHVKPGAEVGSYLKKTRPGLPMYLSLILVEKLQNSILVEVECRPTMWFRISVLGENEFTDNQVQEALLETESFVKQTMSAFEAKEVEPISVYPIIQRTEIRNRLLNLGLEEAVRHLDKAEKHIVQNNFEESLKSSRTAFEKMIDWEIKKRGLEKTNNYKNDLERLQSKGFIDLITTELIQTYYRCLSNIAVHAKGEVPPGFHEAQMGYGITLIMLQYFADKLP